MAKVSADTIIADVLEMDAGAAPIFMSNGMFCMGCPSAMGESIGEACVVHGMDPEKLISELNELLSSSGEL